MFAATLLLLSAVSSTMANPFITSPTQTTTWQAGQNVTIVWEDDGTAPSLQQFGLATIGIYAGSQSQQTELQVLTAGFDVSTANSYSFVPDATIGPNSNVYFVRIDSINAKNPNNTAFPAQAFSAKFTLSGMTGNFSTQVQAEINGSTATSATTPTGAATVGATTTPSTSSGPTSAKTSTSSAPSTTTTTKKSGADRVSLTTPSLLIIYSLMAILLF